MGSCVVKLTCGLPQSQISFPSLIPLPQVGVPTVVVGSLLRQPPRLDERELSALTLQVLHLCDAGKLETAAITHLPEGSLQLHEAAIMEKHSWYISGVHRGCDVLDPTEYLCGTERNVTAVLDLQVSCCMFRRWPISCASVLPVESTEECLSCTTPTEAEPHMVLR